MLTRFAQYVIVAGLVGVASWVFLSTPAYAQQPTATPPIISLDDETALESLSASGPPVELVEQRTATAKHYQLGPVLYRASISSVPIHYRDAAGMWQNADTRPVATSAGGYEVVKSDVKLFFPPSLASGLSVDALVDLPDPNTAVVSAVTDANGKPDFSAIPADVAAANTEPPPPPVRLLFQWQPQGFDGATATATESGVTYDTLTFYPTTTGFKQVIDQPAAPYVVRMTLPPDTTLHNAAGQVQPGSFSSASFSLRTPDGAPLLHFSAPTAFNTNGTATAIPYTVQRQGDAIIIIAAAPAGTQQLVAEVVTPFTDLSVQPRATIADWIWACQPTTTTITTDTLRVGTRFDTGCTLTGTERALVQWDITSIPLNANLAIPEDAPLNSAVLGDISTRLYHLPAQGTGGGPLNINTHRFQLPWTQNEVTWLSRTNTITWTEAGGSSVDYDLNVEATATVDSTTTGYISMGTVHDLVGAWRTHQYTFDDVAATPCPSRNNCFGSPNYGVLYRAADESSNTDLDRVFASGAMTATTPLLNIDYTTLLFTVPTDSNLRIPRTPSPDTYQAIIPANSWQVIAIRPNEDNRADYDLITSQASNIVAAFNAPVKISQQRGVNADVIAFNNRTAGDITINVWVYPFQGTGYYDIRQLETENTLVAGSNTVAPVISLDTLVRFYEVNLVSGESYEFTLQNTSSGEADLSLAIFPPAQSGTAQAFNLLDDGASVDAGSFGDNETLLYTAQDTGPHALLVLNNGNGDTTVSQFELAATLNPQFVYMPATLRNFPQPPPPSVVNGTFDSNLDNWAATNPGSVLVATAATPGSTTPTPDTSCFGGGQAAMLGTPTTSDNEINNIPVDEKVTLAQTIDIPTTITGSLTFNYKVLSYDLVQNDKGQLFDYFNVVINNTPVLTDGNTDVGSIEAGEFSLWESDCKQSSINLTSYAGQSITIRFQVWNRVYADRNTWAFVDDVVIE